MLDASSLDPRTDRPEHRFRVRALATLAGLAFVLWLLPIEVFDPQATRWLLSGDSAGHYLGWEFFRREAWDWPPGRLTRFGLEMGSSIVYTDSIPLVALALKPVSPLLPATIQYTGWWIAACYLLAAGFAWRCGMRATGRIEAAAACALFAILSPILALRVQGHFALMGQWLIWWALGDYLAMRPIARASRIACACVAALVHAYLLLIVLAIVAADAVRRSLVLREWTARQVAVHAGTLVACVAAVLWLAGYFALEAPGASADMYGRFATHAGAFWNPVGVSPFLPNLALAPDVASMEGANYLGFGALLLVAGALVVVALHPQARRGITGHWPLLAAALVFTAIAVTHRVHYGDRLLLELPLSADTLEVLATFRASGRLAWLAYYAAIAASVVVVVRWLPRRAAFVALGVAAAVQVADLAGFYVGLRSQYAELVARHSRETPRLDSAFWREAAQRYDRVLVAPMDHQAPHWITLGAWAAEHGLAINVGQFARASWPAFQDAYFELLRTLEAGTLDPAALYVLPDPARVKLGALHPDDAAMWIDGMYVIAPRWQVSQRAVAGETRRSE